MATREQLIEDFADHKYATGEKFARLINSMKVVQDPVETPAASGTSLSFIDSIEQDADGKITATKKTLDLSNAHEINPFKGWWKTGDTLPTSGFDGAYLYFKDTTQTPAVTTIYRWNGTTYADTGTVVDESNVQTFGSGQQVNAVKIKDENGEEVTGPADVLSAEAGAEINNQIMAGYFVGNDQTYSSSSAQFKLKSGYHYRVIIISDYQYQSANYIFSINSYWQGQQTTLNGTRNTDTPEPYYDIVIPENSEYVEIGGRASAGKKVYFHIVECESLRVESGGADIEVTDVNGNTVLVIDKGHLKTKNFDSDLMSQEQLGLEQKVQELSEEIKISDEDGNGKYYGDIIQLTPHNYIISNWNEFTINSGDRIQSFSVYGDYIVLVRQNPYGTGALWRISTNTKIADINFSYGTLTAAPHSNVANFSRTFAEDNTDLPLFYLSQWDNEGACLVYNIKLDGTCTLVQTILSDDNMPSIFGQKLGDWVLDNENGYIWSAKYKLNSAITNEGNAMMFCKFKIPSITNSTVTLSQNDILDSFEIANGTAPLTLTQDKVIDGNGHMLIARGYPTSHEPLCVFMIDLNSKSYIGYIDMKPTMTKEPEGIDVVGELLLVSDGSRNSNGKALIYKIKL